MVWWLGFLVFIQASQVQFLDRKLRSCFMPPLTAASLRLLYDKVETSKLGDLRTFLSKIKMVTVQLFILCFEI